MICRDYHMETQTQKKNNNENHTETNPAIQNAKEGVVCYIRLFLIA